MVVIHIRKSIYNKPILKSSESCVFLFLKFFFVGILVQIEHLKATPTSPGDNVFGVGFNWKMNIHNTIIFS